MATRRAVGLLFLLSAFCGALALVLAAALRWKLKKRLEGDGKMTHACMCRAILLVSLGKEKVDRLWSNRAILERRVSELAEALRNERGVRHIEAVIIQNWRSDSKGLDRAPWRPAGALIFVEAKDDAGVERAIENIWDKAKLFDQDVMVLNGIDSW